jgi:gluconokinase
VVLAIDAGSTTAKAQFFDTAGWPLGPAVRSLVALGPDGTADPVAFLASVEAAVDEALRRRGTEAVDAVALSCAWHGLVGLGRDGQPTTPLSAWSATGPAVTAGAVELRRRLEDAGVLAAVVRRTGAPVHPSFPAARLLAEGVRDPAAFAATARWCSIGELLETRWLAGRPGPSSSMASATGLFDQEAMAWDDEVLEAIGVRRETLAPVDDSPRRGLDPVYAARWPALASATWWPALGDGAGALIGTGCGARRAAQPPGQAPSPDAGPSGHASPPDAGPAGDGVRPVAWSPGGAVRADAGSAGASARRAALTVGTSAAVRVLAGAAERAARPAGLFAYLLDRDRVVLGAARSNAGNLVDWLARVLRLDGDIVAEVVARPPGSHGLQAVPALAGERSPDWPAVASGSLAGLHPDTTALDIAQALLEAAVCGVADAVDSLGSALSCPAPSAGSAPPAGPTGLVLVGSGRALVESAAWRQLVADATGRPLVPSRVEEGSARGAALATLEGLGWLDADTADPSVLDGDPILPDPTRAAAFAALRDRRAAPATGPFGGC